LGPLAAHEEEMVDSPPSSKDLAELSAGRDPKTGRRLGARNVVQRTDVIRALDYAVHVLDGTKQVVVRPVGPRTPKKPRKAMDSLTHWTVGEERAIRHDRAAGMKPSQVARDFERPTEAVRARLRKLDAEAG
jgi:hypothetical protein